MFRVSRFMQDIAQPGAAGETRKPSGPVVIWNLVPRDVPDREHSVRARLMEWGGNASGVNVANIDNLGNVRERKFSGFWLDTRAACSRGWRASCKAWCATLSIVGNNECDIYLIRNKKSRRIGPPLYQRSLNCRTGPHRPTSAASLITLAGNNE
jgi:hypothetical protein